MPRTGRLLPRLSPTVGQPVQFVVPEEGSTLFIDNLVIPTSARRADLAHKLIDYLMQPQRVPPDAHRLWGEQQLPAIVRPCGLGVTRCIGEQLSEVDRVSAHPIALVEPGKQQQILDKAGHTHRLGFDTRDRVRGLLRKHLW